MLKLLVKKQLTSIFRSYFYDAKKNQKRPALSVTLYFLFFALIMLGVLGGMFTWLSIVLCAPMIAAGAGWLYFALMGIIAIALGTFGSVFNTYSELYLAKDNDQLLSLPIPVRTIVTSRLVTVYLMGLLYSAMASVPAVIVYCCVAPLTPMVLLGGLVFVLLISLFVLELSCALGWVVAVVSLRVRNKSFAVVAASLLFIAGYYFVSFKAQGVLQEILLNAAFYADSIRGVAWPLYLFGRMGEGDAAAMLLSAAVVGLLLALLWRLLSRSFLGLATGTGRSAQRQARKGSGKQKSVASALLGKELARFFASPNYIMNCGLGSIFMPLAAVLLLWKGDAFLELIDAMLGGCPGALPVMLGAGMGALLTTNDITAPSVSLEGKGLWLSQSLPVSPWQVLRAKLQAHLLLTFVPAVPVMAVILVRSPGALTLLGAVCAALLLWMWAEAGLILGVTMPNLTWTNELAPIKQSLPVLLALTGGWAISAGIGALYLWQGWRIGAAAYLAAWSALLLALGLVLRRWLRTRCAAAFAAL